jgi:hypothetical protein
MIFVFVLILFPIKPPANTDSPAIITEVKRLKLGIKNSEMKTTIPTN